jgi:energy-coupling factor transporter ATP-binding protein EcfA2
LLQRLHIRNYRSIADATVELRPFTVLVGANGSGKSNLLKLLNELSHPGNGQLPRLTRHFRNPSEEPAVEMTTPSGRFIFKGAYATQGRPAELANVAIFEIDPRCIGAQEPLIGQPVVQANGYGAIQVLDSLKTGDRENLFDTVERRSTSLSPRSRS